MKVLIETIKMPIQLLPTAINFLGKQLSKTVGKKAF